MTQTNAVVAYITVHGSITQKEAESIGVMRLASRIHDAKRQGYHIVDSWEIVPTRYGNGKTRVKRYRFGGSDND